MDYRLRPDVSEKMQAAGKSWPPKSRLFREFFKNQRYVGQAARTWRSLIDGDPVPAVIAQAFAAFLREKAKLPWATVNEVFEAVMPDAGAWESPDALYECIATPFNDIDGMYIVNPYDDFMLAARMVIFSVGYKMALPGDPLDEVTCLHRGSQKMGRTIEKYAGWMRRITRGDQLFRVVMFYFVGGRRIGVTVLLPLKEESFHRLCSGQIREDELDADDLEAPTRYLFMSAMSDGQGVRNVNVLSKTIAQTNVFLYQMAYLSRGIKPFRPIIASFASNAHYEKLLMNQGFAPNGHTLKDTNFPVLILQHPEEMGYLSPKALGKYNTFVRLMRIYRFFNRKQWRKEDSPNLR